LRLLAKHNIVISPIGAMDPAIPAKISQAIQQVFGFKTENISLFDNAEFAYNPLRDQYLSTLILEKLTELAPPQSLKIMALCEIDLFVPILTYVYGEAQLSGKSCIVSLYRLKNQEAPITIQTEAFNTRAVKEAIHELGHTFGLRHCPDHACLMHYCRSIEDVDRKSDQFCRYCRIMLEDVIT
jgi:archaemetzincin